jgi:hypothetical protein
VLVEHGEHGSSAAAPIATELIKTFLRAERPAGLAAKDQDQVGEEDQGG